jgi:hypothetical protein
VVAWALVACASGPRQPAAGERSVATELVFYRALSRADFRAEAAVGDAVTEAERVGATTCADISMRPDAFTVRPERSVTGETLHVVSLDAPIFFAVFRPACSWWDPDGVLPEQDVLEHEQIHFALVELEARRMNGRVEQIAERVAASGIDLEATRRVALERLRAILEEARRTASGRAELFDAQVYPHDRVRVRQWFLKISSELETTDRFARGPQTVAPAAVASAAVSLPPTPSAVNAATNSPSPSSPPLPSSPPVNHSPAVTPPSIPVAAPGSARTPAPAAPAPPPTVPARGPTVPASTGAFPD